MKQNMKQKMRAPKLLAYVSIIIFAISFGTITQCCPSEDQAIATLYKLDYMISLCRKAALKNKASQYPQILTLHKVTSGYRHTLEHQRTGQSIAQQPIAQQPVSLDQLSDQTQPSDLTTKKALSITAFNASIFQTLQEVIKTGAWKIIDQIATPSTLDQSQMHAVNIRINDEINAFKGEIPYIGLTPVRTLWRKTNEHAKELKVDITLQKMMPYICLAAILYYHQNPDKMPKGIQKFLGIKVKHPHNHAKKSDSESDSDSSESSSESDPSDEETPHINRKRSIHPHERVKPTDIPPLNLEKVKGCEVRSKHTPRYTKTPREMVLFNQNLKFNVDDLIVLGLGAFLSSMIKDDVKYLGNQWYARAQRMLMLINGKDDQDDTIEKTTSLRKLTSIEGHEKIKDELIKIMHYFAFKQVHESIDDHVPHTYVFTGNPALSNDFADALCGELTSVIQEKHKHHVCSLYRISAQKCSKNLLKNICDAQKHHIPYIIVIEDIDKVISNSKEDDSLSAITRLLRRFHEHPMESGIVIAVSNTTSITLPYTHRLDLSPGGNTQK